MKKVKKAVGIRIGQHVHNTEDARVKVEAAPQQKDHKWGNRLKNLAVKAAKVAKVAKRIPYYIWIWEKAVIAWDWICENAETIFEVIS
ncbi:hypothetical protein K3369_20200 [Pseudomonas mandelii]|uniref:hypothetical protein n=1 Tax=Pseudomonas mandelii TaxID=75612 RepID=UPI001C829DE4|nr:hypothetical protein [Pseudomonas mandelii]QZA96079.1 hypothetical protein K3369_20200 [Pseudomonas mandelii]